MRCKKLISFMVIALLVFAFAGCGSDSQSGKSDEPKVKTITMDAFKTEIKNLGIEATEEETLYEMVGATSGYKLSADGKTLELYGFDKDADAYKKAEKEGSLYMESLNTSIEENVTVKNGYAIILPKDFPQYDAIMALFERLE